MAVHLRRRRWLAVAALTLVSMGAGLSHASPDADRSPPPPVTEPPPARELIVFAAASLREPLEALARVFEARHPNTRVRFNLAGSQELRFQIQQGAKADVFASADLVHAAALAQEGLTAAPRTFARNLPVVVVPRANPAGLTTFADLPKAKRLVVGAPDVPIGRYTLTIFSRAASVYGDAFGKAVNEHIASRELNVRQVLAKVSLGEADAGVVYRSDAAVARDTVTVIDIPPSVAVVAEYAVAPVKAAPQPALARAWCDLLLSAEAGAVLGRAGFLPGEVASVVPDRNAGAKPRP